MRYDFRANDEAVWFVLTTVGTSVLQMLQGAPPADMKVWAMGVGAAAVRAGLGAILHLMTTPPAPVPVAPTGGAS